MRKNNKINLTRLSISAKKEIFNNKIPFSSQNHYNTCKHTVWITADVDTTVIRRELVYSTWYGRRHLKGQPETIYNKWKNRKKPNFAVLAAICSK